LKGGFDAWKESGKEIDSTKRISAEALAEMEAPLVFDVRKRSEFDSQHMEGATNVPLNEINQHLAQFPKDKPFVIHCAGGYRSMIASSILKQRGWDNFVDVREGFKGMAETSLPMTEYRCPTTML
jgi:rhodanese-related sulfurtransferase